MIELPILPNKYNKILLRNIYNKINDVLGRYFVICYRKYYHLHDKLSLDNNYRLIGSTYMVLMVSFIIVGTKNPNVDVNKSFVENFLFAMMYNLVDTILDTPTNNRDEYIKAIRSILFDNVKISNSPIVNALYEIYLYFSDREEVVEAMRMAFIEEYKSYLVQKSIHEEYKHRDVCEGIGYTMFNLFLRINNLPTDEYHDRIVGYVGQLIDDISDMDSDINDGINTLAIVVYRKDGNVDRLYHEVVSKLEALPDDQYEVIKYPLIYFFYFIAHNSKYISDDVKCDIRKYQIVLCDVYIDDLGKYVYDMINAH